MQVQALVRAGCGLLMVVGVMTIGQVRAESLRTDTFVVHCYDVGHEVLVGRQGIRSVSSGWHDGREVNRVTYDQEKISRTEIEERLKDAGTYSATIETKQP
jgi:hypothetical protein